MDDIIGKAEYVVALNTTTTDNPMIVRVMARSQEEALGKVLIDYTRFNQITGWAIDGPTTIDIETWVRENAKPEYRAHLGKVIICNKIALIKEVRKRAGSGLKEAKNFVEDIITKHGLDLPF